MGRNKYTTRIILLLVCFVLSCTDGSINNINDLEYQSVQINQRYYIAENRTLNLSNPITFNLNKLNELRDQYLINNNALPQVIQSIITEADYTLNIEAISVTNRKRNLQGVDANDYLSLATYFWPNPDTDSGLPYVRRDGERNPDVDLYNRNELSELSRAIAVLSFSYYITQEEKYATKAIFLLEKWFLDPVTRMTPHLNHSQFVPGVSDGRFLGIIQGRAFVRVYDKLSLLQSSPSWNRKFEEGLYNWLSEFNRWLINSGKGKLVADYHNNHSTIYDLQVAYYSSILRKEETLVQILENVYSKRVLTQIEESGVQTYEVQRKDGLKYSTLNLHAHIQLAKLNDNFHIRLEEHSYDYPLRLTIAIDYLIPAVIDNGVWQHRQNSPYDACEFLPILEYSNEHLDQGSYNETIDILKTQFSCEFESLLY